MNNKLTLEGIEYELVPTSELTVSGKPGHPPIIIIESEMFLGKAIVDKRLPVEEPPEQKSEEQKDWEALSFIYQHYIYCPRENGGYKKDLRYAIEPEGPSEHDWLGSVPSGATIFSVKRLSDGEIFSIGDRLSSSPEIVIEIAGFDIPEGAGTATVLTKEHGYWPLVHIKKAEKIKEWEVISFQHNSQTFHKDGEKYRARMPLIRPEPTMNLNPCLNNVPPEAKIISIKRLSDGEVFSVGDYVDMINAHKITRMIIGGAPQNHERNKILVWLSTSDAPYHHGVDLMVATKHKPKPIFKTHDGVEYFEGQENELLFGVVPKGTWETRDKRSVRIAANWINRSWIYFSTKEAMDKYIFAYRPYLSYEDVIKFIIQEDVGDTMRGIMIAHLTDFLKQKINGIQ